MLEPAAWFQVRVGLPVELGPVIDAAVEKAAVDEVEVVGLKRPVELGVIDLEGHVGRREGGLYGGDVGADYGGGGGLGGYVDGPVAGASADVEDGLGVGDGCEVEFVGEEDEHVFVAGTC